MATFHRMQDENGKDVVRCFVKGAPDQLLARATPRLDPEDLSTSIAADDAFKQRYMDENERLGEPGPARPGDRAQGLRPRRVRPEGRSAAAAGRA